MNLDQLCFICRIFIFIGIILLFWCVLGFFILILFCCLYLIAHIFQSTMFQPEFWNDSARWYFWDIREIFIIRCLWIGGLSFWWLLLFISEFLCQLESLFWAAGKLADLLAILSIHELASDLLNTSDSISWWIIIYACWVAWEAWTQNIVIVNFGSWLFGSICDFLIFGFSSLLKYAFFFFFHQYVFK